MSTMTAEAPPLAALTDAELAALFHGAGEDQAAAILTEAQRRDDAGKRRQARRQEPAACAWEEAARAQYAQAEQDCHGNLIARDAPPWLTDEFSLWRYGNDRYATEELRRWFLDHPRLTITRYQQQVRDNQEAYTHELDSDAADAVRLGASADASRAEDHHDSTGNLVSRVPARNASASSTADDGPVRDGQHVRPGGAVTSFAAIEPLAQEWIWANFIPQAEMVVLAATGGSGKSFVTVDIAARVSRGLPMPDGSPGIPASSVILVNLEDSAEVGTVHRLRAAGADLSKVHDMSTVGGHPFSIPEDIPALRAAISDIGDVGLVVVDPLAAASSVSLTSVMGARAMVRELQAVAHDTGVAVVAVHHLTKAGSVGGSQSIVDAPRLALLIEPDKTAADGTKIMKVHKTNISPAGAVIRYRLAGTWPETVVGWAPAAGDRQTVGLSAADAVLLALDSADGPLSPRELTATTGQNYGAVRVACSRLLAADRIGMTGRGMYVSHCNNADVSAGGSGLRLTTV
jgi:hypothetical protein